MKTTRNYAEIIRQRLKSNPALAEAVEEARFNANVAEEIYAARIEAGKTQVELAELAGMKQSAIARLEDADYGRHSLSSLKRIASALSKRLEIKLTDTYINKEPPIIEEDNFEIDALKWKDSLDKWSIPGSSFYGKNTLEVIFT